MLIASTTLSPPLDTKHFMQLKDRSFNLIKALSLQVVVSCLPLKKFNRENFSSFSDMADSQIKESFAECETSHICRVLMQIANGHLLNRLLSVITGRRV